MKEKAKTSTQRGDRHESRSQIALLYVNFTPTGIYNNITKYSFVFCCTSVFACRRRQGIQNGDQKREAHAALRQWSRIALP